MYLEKRGTGTYHPCKQREKMASKPLRLDILRFRALPRLRLQQNPSLGRYEKHIWLKPSHLRNSFVWNKTQDAYVEVRLDECIWLQFWWPSWRFLMLVAATFCCGKLTANGHWEAVTRYFPYTKMTKQDSVLVIPLVMFIDMVGSKNTRRIFRYLSNTIYLYGYIKFAQIIPAKRSTPPTSSDLGWKTIPLGTPATLRILTLQKKDYFGDPLLYRFKTNPSIQGSKVFQGGDFLWNSFWRIPLLGCHRKLIKG